MYLLKLEDLNEKSIEEIVVEPLLDSVKNGFKVKELDVTSSKLMLAIVSEEIETAPEGEWKKMYEELSELTHLGELFNKRLELFNVKLDYQGLVFFTLTYPNPSQLIMLSWTLRSIATRLGKDELSTLELFKSYFSWGVPCSYVMHDIWINQKVDGFKTDVGSDNLVDYSKFGASLY